MNTNLRKILDDSFGLIGYTPSQSKKAISDLESVIAVYYFNEVAKILDEKEIGAVDINDYGKVIEIAKEKIDKNVLRSLLTKVTNEVITKYFDELFTNPEFKTVRIYNLARNYFTTNY